MRRIELGWGIAAALLAGACGNGGTTGTPTAPPDVTPIDTRPIEPPASEPPAPTAPRPKTPDAEGEAPFEGTTGVAEKKRPGVKKPVILREVRVGEHEGYERMVFEIAGDELPGYRVTYTDKPSAQCGSGDPSKVAGKGWLEVRLSPAQAHDEAGKVTIADRERHPKLEVVQEMELTCDFEGEVTWSVGVAERNKFRVLELSKPARIVIDVRR